MAATNGQFASELLSDLRSELPSQAAPAFDLHHRRVRNLIMNYMTDLHLAKFMWYRPFKEHYYRCISSCYENQDEAHLSVSILGECVSKCKAAKRRVEQTRQKVYYMSMFSLQNKMTKCSAKASPESAEFLDCEWTALSKIKRRLDGYWKGQLDKLFGGV